MGPIFCFYQNFAFVCQQKPFVIVLVKLKRKFPSNRCFIGCLIRISVKVLFHDIFALRLHLDRNDSKIVFSIMIL